MLSYGGVALQIPSSEEAAWLEANIRLQESFSFWRPKAFFTPQYNPRPHFAWWLARPFKLNCYVNVWGAARWSYAFVLADGGMISAISAQNRLSPTNANGVPLAFYLSDGITSSITTSLYMLPPVPLAKIMNVTPQLPLWLLPLVDKRYFWWERAAEISVTENTTTWAQLYASIATALGITITVDPVNSAYLKPGVGLAQQHYPYLPLLLDWAAASCGQRFVRRLDNSFAAINSTTALALQSSQVNQNRKLAGGTLSLGVVNG